MTKFFGWRSAAIAIGLLILGTASASAQTPTIRADIPFAFTAGSQLLPAGSYEFQVDLDHSLARIASDRGANLTLVRLVPGGSDRRSMDAMKAMLRFQHYGEKYVLVGIWRPGSIESNALAHARVPREYSKVQRQDVVAR